MFSTIKAAVPISKPYSSLRFSRPQLCRLFLGRSSAEKESRPSSRVSSHLRSCVPLRSQYACIVTCQAPFPLTRGYDSSPSSWMFTFLTNCKQRLGKPGRAYHIPQHKTQYRKTIETNLSLFSSIMCVLLGNGLHGTDAFALSGL